MEHKGPEGVCDFGCCSYSDTCSPTCEREGYNFIIKSERLVDIIIDPEQYRDDKVYAKESIYPNCKILCPGLHLYHIDIRGDSLGLRYSPDVRPLTISTYNDAFRFQQFPYCFRSSLIFESFKVCLDTCMKDLNTFIPNFVYTRCVIISVPLHRKFKSYRKRIYPLPGHEFVDHDSLVAEGIPHGDNPIGFVENFKKTIRPEDYISIWDPHV